MSSLGANVSEQSVSETRSLDDRKEGSRTFWIGLLHVETLVLVVWFKNKNMLQHFRGNLFTKSPKIIASSISKNVNEPVNYGTEGVTLYMQTCPLPLHTMYRQII